MMRKKTNMIVVHCAATPPDMDVGAREIDRWHRARGWLGIGYHYVVRRDGTLEYGRDPGDIGAHAYGYNKESVGICLIGGVDADMNAEDNFTDAQIETLKEQIEAIQSVYGGDLKVVGHNELSEKACPSFNVGEKLYNQ